MISILLAAYNGEKYIGKQIESLLAQTVQDFKLYICDDGSTDRTLSIITEYAGQYPKKIFVAQNKVNSGGAKYNFIQMMIRHKDDYVMLCDQDDVWLQNKIEKTLAKMNSMEALYGDSMPLLVFTDLKVVDSRLKIISDSYQKTMAADFSKTSLHHIMVQNILAGCTAMYNKALADIIRNSPDYMVMHDWWLILLASAFGQIGVVDEQTILYRQHETNDTGVKKARSLKHIAYEVSHYSKMAAAINQTYMQADSLLKMYRDRLSEGQIKLLISYSSIPGQMRIRRLKTLFQCRTFKNGLTRKIAQIMIVLRERRVRI